MIHLILPELSLMITEQWWGWGFGGKIWISTCIVLVTYRPQQSLPPWSGHSSLSSSRWVSAKKAGTAISLILRAACKFMVSPVRKRWTYHSFALRPSYWQLSVTLWYFHYWEGVISIIGKAFLYCLRRTGVPSLLHLPISLIAVNMSMGNCMIDFVG